MSIGGVSDGQLANENTFDLSFMARNANTDTVGELALLNPAPANSPTISNVQKYINKLGDFTGTNELDATPKDYASNNYIADGDSLKVCVTALDSQLGITQGDLDIAEMDIDNLEGITDDHEARITTLELNNTEDVTLAAIGTTPNANGATLTGQILNLEPANATFGGVVSTLAQTFAGDKTFNDDVIIEGDLTVNGTATTLNTQTLDVEDTNITVNKTGNDISAQGAGLTVERTGTHGSLVYDSASPSKFKCGNLGSEENILTSSSLNYSPTWVKYVIDYTSLSDVSNVADFQLFLLPIKGMIRNMIVSHNTAFNGPSLTEFKVSTGVTGYLNKYADNFDAALMPADGNYQLVEVNDYPSKINTTSIRLKVEAVGCNLNQLTQGQLEIHVLWSKLP